MKLCAQIVVLVAATVALAVSFGPTAAEPTEPAPASVTASGTGVAKFRRHVPHPVYRPAFTEEH